MSKTKTKNSNSRFSTKRKDKNNKKLNSKFKLSSKLNLINRKKYKLSKKKSNQRGGWTLTEPPQGDNAKYEKWSISPTEISIEDIRPIIRLSILRDPDDRTKVDEIVDKIPKYRTKLTFIYLLSQIINNQQTLQDLTLCEFFVDYLQNHEIWRDADFYKDNGISGINTSDLEFLSKNVEYKSEVEKFCQDMSKFLTEHSYDTSRLFSNLKSLSIVLPLFSPKIKIFGDFNIKNFFLDFIKNSSLTKLSIAGSSLHIDNTDFFRELCETIINKSSIEDLDLSNCGLSLTNLKILGTLLKIKQEAGPLKLKRLSLSGNKRIFLEEDGGVTESSLSTLMMFKGLEYLDLTNLYDMSDDNTIVLCEYLSYLDLSEVKVFESYISFKKKLEKDTDSTQLYSYDTTWRQYRRSEYYPEYNPDYNLILEPRYLQESLEHLLSSKTLTKISISYEISSDILFRILNNPNFKELNNKTLYCLYGYYGERKIRHVKHVKHYHRTGITMKDIYLLALAEVCFGIKIEFFNNDKYSEYIKLSKDIKDLMIANLRKKMIKNRSSVCSIPPSYMKYTDIKYKDIIDLLDLQKPEKKTFKDMMKKGESQIDEIELKELYRLMNDGTPTSLQVTLDSEHTPSTTNNHSRSPSHTPSTTNNYTPSPLHTLSPTNNTYSLNAPLVYTKDIPARNSSKKCRKDKGLREACVVSG